ncbi:F0F1-type ATP synthase, epsilon subunit [Deferribacter desulfuricans SSM1]|uniref:ATP synthase epsilon chain n=1 Tax=Deferribacter desulfuricans (strain DSM 14783 / JCM 11476 / NBRC 101012 / SSM1) TaxID=639282 RepID=D3P9E7_DEFDS|nr:F0F1 ATP synthase subunit epsilon [Deferribacter desulfuricans]BAI81337.1 F0F1-type ATP synthase, epsilon subunit [Deferribacter desulfuricans SSM1]
MAEKLRFILVSPERELLNDEVDEVIAPGVEGDFGILPGHTPFLTALRVGELIYKKDGNEEYVALDRGFLEVSDDVVTVLAESAELGREIDLEEAIRRKLEAEKALEAARKEDEIKFRKVEAQLQRELLRVSVAERYKR